MKVSTHFNEDIHDCHWIDGWGTTMDTVKGVWLRIDGRAGMQSFAALAASSTGVPWPGIGEVIVLPGGQALRVYSRTYHYADTGLTGIVFGCERV